MFLNVVLVKKKSHTPPLMSHIFTQTFWLTMSQIFLLESHLLKHGSSWGFHAQMCSVAPLLPLSGLSVTWSPENHSPISRRGEEGLVVWVPPALDHLIRMLAGHRLRKGLCQVAWGKKKENRVFITPQVSEKWICSKSKLLQIKGLKSEFI